MRARESDTGVGVIATMIGDRVEVTIDAGSAIIASVSITQNASTTPGIDNLEVCFGGAASCYADCDMNGSHHFFDFLCFQNAFAAGCR